MYYVISNLFCFRNKVKEESRLEKLKAFQETGVWPGMKTKTLENVAWSEKQDKKARKNERKRRKELKAPEEPSVIDTDDDDDNLEEDYRLLKKMKKVRNIVLVFLIRIM